MNLIRAILLLMIPVGAAQASVTHEPFGKLPDGSTVEIYTLKSDAVEMRVMTYGPIVVSVKTKDRSGHVGEIVLGHNTFDEYLADHKTHFGAVVGRFGNRIAAGKFTLEGKPYQITLNNNGNALHGGIDGFDRYNWTAKEVPNGVEFSMVSPDGDQGFPGTMTAHVRYTLVGDTVKLAYSATTDKPTVVNLTNHSYFNLAGDGHGLITDETVVIHADKYTPVKADMIPTGEILPVAGTPLDFTKPHVLKERIDTDTPQLKFALGYDHNFILRGTPGTLRPAATVSDPVSGRVWTVETTEPGVQFYTGNHLDGSFASRTGGKYDFRTGLCLETQHYPDSPNHPEWPSTELKPGETYRSETTWTFGVKR